MTADMDECIQWNQNRVGERTERVLKEGVGLTLMVESRGDKGTKLGTVQGRHETRGGRGRKRNLKGHLLILRHRHADVKRINVGHAADWISTVAARRAEQFRGSVGDA